MENNLNANSDDIKLGGFPPIYFISSENKKKREFKKKVENSIDGINTNINKLNILNIKNILGDKKK